MATAKVELVRSKSDVESVRTLCRAFVAWQLQAFPHLRQQILTYFEPSKWETVLADLPRIHARPKGAMLLASIEDMPVGCIMYHEMTPEIAEMKRLFVDPSARGAGVGRALVSEMLTCAADDGYRHARLDTAKHLTDAIRLYKKAGFHECEPFSEVPDAIRDLVVFMQRPL